MTKSSKYLDKDVSNPLSQNLEFQYLDYTSIALEDLLFSIRKFRFRLLKTSMQKSMIQLQTMTTVFSNIFSNFCCWPLITA